MSKKMLYYDNVDGGRSMAEAIYGLRANKKRRSISFSLFFNVGLGLVLVIVFLSDFLALVIGTLCDFLKLLQEIERA